MGSRSDKRLYFAFKKFSEGPSVYCSPVNGNSPEEIEDSNKILTHKRKNTDSNIYDCTKRVKMKHLTPPVLSTSKLTVTEDDKAKKENNKKYLLKLKEKNRQKLKKIEKYKFKSLYDYSSDEERSKDPYILNNVIEPKEKKELLTSIYP